MTRSELIVAEIETVVAKWRARANELTDMNYDDARIAATALELCADELDGVARKWMR